MPVSNQTKPNQSIFVCLIGFVKLHLWITPKPNMFNFMDTWSWSGDVICLICHTPHLCANFLTNIMLLGTCGMTSWEFHRLVLVCCSGEGEFVGVAIRLYCGPGPSIEQWVLTRSSEGCTPDIWSQVQVREWRYREGKELCVAQYSSSLTAAVSGTSYHQHSVLCYYWNHGQRFLPRSG